jgi:phosphoribosyl-ATP pyrophosphohydrolase/phosphoribosyl-AMP cyclohydrolase
MDDPKFDEGGLIPAVVQDALDGRVLMVAYMNSEALEKTKVTGYVHFWSRSRKELWRKGETSGNQLRYVSHEADCDGDVLLVRVRPEGPTCHLGRPSCFPSASVGVLGDLEALLAERRRNPRESSYSSALMADEAKRLKKVVEEAGEVVVAARGGSDDEVVHEAADLTFHLLVLLAARGIPWSKVLQELEGRRR